ncbi:MAG: SPFH domain-containing protein [Clostridia bacterium]
MGLIKAALGSLGGTLADQWKEYFCCDAIDADTLVVKGYKKSGKRSSNTKGSDNVITDGSVISVADGQCMMIVEQGRVREISAEPGAFTYSNKSEPSFFGGGFIDGLKGIFETTANRFAFGGEAGGDQRIYYFNMKEIYGIKYGTATPIPFRVVDHNVGLDIDISIRCNGEYSYKIVNPMLFYANVCGNITHEFRRTEIDSMLKSEFMTALQPAFAKISELGIRYSSVPAHTFELTKAVNEVLCEQWKDTRGLEIASIGVNSMTASKEDEQLIKDLQRARAMSNANVAAGTMVGAQADAMKAAASNANGAMMGFMGMNMAQNTGGINAQSLFNMSNQQQPQQPAPTANSWTCTCGTSNTGKFCNNCGSQKPVAEGSWTCSCGTVNTGKFCNNCGTQKPAEGWTCSCGTTNKGKFCSNCGKPSMNFKCDKCGWVPEDKSNPPKFCPECGDIFDDKDRI